MLLTDYHKRAPDERVVLPMAVGQVIDGLLTVRKIENVPVGGGSKPMRTVTISECGEM